MNITLPFQGFYESLWSSGIDQEQDSFVENYLEDNPSAESSNIHDGIWRHANYKKAYLEVTKAYTQAFQNWINAECQTDITFNFDELTSPKEYNFTTDRIFCNISEVDVLKLVGLVTWAEIADVAKETFTSRDGFISFYSPDIDTWGDVSTWDHNQLGCLLAAVVASVGDDDWEFNLYSELSEGETFYSAFHNCVDWDKGDTNAIP